MCVCVCVCLCVVVCTYCYFCTYMSALYRVCVCVCVRVCVWLVVCIIIAVYGVCARDLRCCWVHIRRSINMPAVCRATARARACVCVRMYEQPMLRAHTKTPTNLLTNTPTETVVGHYLTPLTATFLALVIPLPVSSSSSTDRPSTILIAVAAVAIRSLWYRKSLVKP